MFEWLGPCCIKRISWPPLFLLVVLLLNFSKMFKGSFFYLCIDRAVCSSSKRRKTRIPLISICRIRFLVLTTHTVCILCMYSSSRKDEISVFNSKISTVGGRRVTRYRIFTSLWNNTMHHTSHSVPPPSIIILHILIIKNWEKRKIRCTMYDSI